MVRMGENICADKRKPVMVTMRMTVWTKLIVRTTVLTVVMIRMTTIRMTLTVVFTVRMAVRVRMIIVYCPFPVVTRSSNGQRD